MDKKQYKAPVSEFVEFEMGDIVATYGGENPDNPEASDIHDSMDNTNYNIT